MDEEDIRHWQHLIFEHKRHLRIQEEKVAGFGKLNTPAHILKDIEDTQRSIAELEQRIRRRIRNAQDDGKLYRGCINKSFRYEPTTSLALNDGING